MSGPQQQARYWARSFAGWYEFADVEPNGAHTALAALQSRGWLSTLITQNVDRLHHKAGSNDVVELHGTTHVYGNALDLLFDPAVGLAAFRFGVV